jgi:serine/threonine-protein kinase
MPGGHARSRGEVWEGRDRVIERRVAVKLLPHDRRDGSGAKLFFREARTAGRLNHAGVVTVFDLGQDPDDGTLYLVMEFLTGRDLDTVLREDGAPQVATAVDWAAQTAEALKAAHAAGIVHRDLKPANLMLAPDGRIKILDFGIARYIASTHKSSKVIGTLAYMPPSVSATSLPNLAPTCTRWAACSTNSSPEAPPSRPPNQLR